MLVLKTLKGHDIAALARQIVDNWGVGNRLRNDGVLYALAVGDRKHHLFAGLGILRDLPGGQHVRIWLFLASSCLVSAPSYSVSCTGSLYNSPCNWFSLPVAVAL